MTILTGIDNDADYDDNDDDDDDDDDDNDKSHLILSHQGLNIFSASE